MSKKLKVFISSTVKDLGAIRNSLKNWIDSQQIAGCEFSAILNESGNVPHNQNLDPREACIEEVKKCDVFVLIVSGRFGCLYCNDPNISVTMEEYLTAREYTKPVYIFIRKDVLEDYEKWEKGFNIPLFHSIDNDLQTDAKKIFNFIKKIYSDRKPPACFNFLDNNNVKDIKEILLIQMTSLLTFQWREYKKQSIGFKAKLVSNPQPKSKIFGREKELTATYNFLVSDNTKSVYLVHAIGGMGKTSLIKAAACFINEQPAPTSWTGLFWYSFYGEGHNDFAIFLQGAIAAMSRKEEYNGNSRNKQELFSEFIKILKSQPLPWIFVMDGLERILVEYKKERNEKQPRNSTRDLEDAGYLTALAEKLTEEKIGKILISSRIIPEVYMGENIEKCKLEALELDAALEMCKALGVCFSNREKTGDFLKKQLGNHPKAIEALSGVITRNFRGNFENWYTAEGRGFEELINLKDVRLPLETGEDSKLNNVIAYSIKNLSIDEKTMLIYSAFFPEKTDESIFRNFYLGKTGKAGTDYNSTSQILSDCNLIENNCVTYLHPLVRKAAIDNLNDNCLREKLGLDVVSHFSGGTEQQKTDYKNITNVSELNNELVVIRVFTKIGKIKEAIDKCTESLLACLVSRKFEDYTALDNIIAPLTTDAVLENINDCKALVKCFHYNALVANRQQFNIDNTISQLGNYLLPKIIKSSELSQVEKRESIEIILKDIFMLANTKHNYALAERCLLKREKLATEDKVRQSLFLEQLKLYVYQCDDENLIKAQDLCDSSLKAKIEATINSEEKFNVEVKYWYYRFKFVKNRKLFLKSKLLTPEEIERKKQYEEELSVNISETQKTDNVRWIRRVLYLLGAWYYNFDDYEKAKELLKESVEHARKNNEYDDFAEATFAATELELEKKNSIAINKERWKNKANELSLHDKNKNLIPIAKILLAIGDEEKAAELAKEQCKIMYGYGEPHIRCHYFEQAKTFLLEDLKGKYALPPLAPTIDNAAPWEKIVDDFLITCR